MYFVFSSSEPKFITGSMPSFEMRNMRLADASTRASSSTTIAWVTRSAPAPPYSAGMPQGGQLHGDGAP